MDTNRGAVRPQDLTILIPAFRCARYLEATVRSALRCEGCPILIVEDCGGDDTFAVAKRLEAEFPDRVRARQNPRNLGCPQNYTESINSIPTKWVMKLDGDDIIFPGYVATAMEFLGSHPQVGLLAGLYERIGADDWLRGEPPEARRLSAGEVKFAGGCEAVRFIFDGVTGRFFSASMIISTQVHRDVGGFDPAIRTMHDIEIWLRVAGVAEVALYPSVAGYYRASPGSVVTRAAAADTWCYENYLVDRSAWKLWGRERHLRPLLRRRIFRDGLYFVKSATRCAMRGMPREAGRRWLSANGAFYFAAFGLPEARKASGGAGKTGAG